MDKFVIKGSEEWSFDKINKTMDILENINGELFELDIYPNQVEIINAETMIDAYSSSAMPVMYPHWSFGGEFLRNWQSYKRGYQGLAYEVVINTNPSIAYLMEENTMLTQALVMAHASFGHNTFFKTNHLFRQWTDASSILDYLIFAKNYIKECESKYGQRKVEFILDACHALMWYGVDRYKRPEKKTKVEKEAERKTREEFRQQHVSELWSTIPKMAAKGKTISLKDWDLPRMPEEPEENILYFIEKHAPKMQTWERELVRIVRKLAQYFYPAINTQLINEGCATFWHYEFMREMERRGHLSEGAVMEFIQLHTAVANQHPMMKGFNVYALGYSIFRDIKRVCNEPTKEDEEWFRGQDWVGSGRWIETIKYACAEHKSDSFVQQYLSPTVMREFNMFSIEDDERKDYYLVKAIQDERGYRKIRENLAQHFNIGSFIPNIQVEYVDVWDTRAMFLKHDVLNGRMLHADTAEMVLDHASSLWGYDVIMNEVTRDDRIVRTIPEDEGGHGDTQTIPILIHP